jgi:shikimate kinase
MYKDNQIVLVGFPGCGKSTVGKKLSSFFNLKFIDLDCEIEKHENLSIPDIFKLKGEDYFRKKEHEILKKTLIYENNFVLATGGGTPCFFNNMSLINQHSISIFLDLADDVLISRILQNKNKRPLFANLSEKEIKTKVSELLAIRKPYYQKSHIQLKNVEKKQNGILKIQEAIGNFLNNST